MSDCVKELYSVSFSFCVCVCVCVCVLQGCGKELSDWLQENALTIVGMDVGLILIQVRTASWTVLLLIMGCQELSSLSSAPGVSPVCHLSLTCLSAAASVWRHGDPVPSL